MEEIGISPERLLRERSRRYRWEREAMEAGISPAIELLERKSSLRADKLEKIGDLAGEEDGFEAEDAELVEGGEEVEATDASDGGGDDSGRTVARALA